MSRLRANFSTDLLSLPKTPSAFGIITFRRSRMVRKMDRALMRPRDGSSSVVPTDALAPLDLAVGFAGGGARYSSWLSRPWWLARGGSARSTLQQAREQPMSNHMGE